MTKLDLMRRYWLLPLLRGLENSSVVIWMMWSSKNAYMVSYYSLHHSTYSSFVDIIHFFCIHYLVNTLPLAMFQHTMTVVSFSITLSCYYKLFKFYCVEIMEKTHCFCVCFQWGQRITAQDFWDNPSAMPYQTLLVSSKLWIFCLKCRFYVIGNDQNYEYFVHLDMLFWVFIYEWLLWLLI